MRSVGMEEFKAAVASRWEIERVRDCGCVFELMDDQIEARLKWEQTP